MGSVDRGWIADTELSALAAASAPKAPRAPHHGGPAGVLKRRRTAPRPRGWPGGVWVGLHREFSGPWPRTLVWLQTLGQEASDQETSASWKSCKLKLGLASAWASTRPCWLAS